MAFILSLYGVALAAGLYQDYYDYDLTDDCDD
jgi:hypothetical protein